MSFPYREVHSFEDATRNFEQIEAAHMFTGTGPPAFLPDGSKVSFYFRTDTPTVANQRIYVFNGTTWTGIL